MDSKLYFIINDLIVLKVIAAAVSVEEMINEHLNESCKQPKVISNIELSSANKVKVLFAFGKIPKNVHDKLLAVINLRNKFAHGKRKKVVENDINLFKYKFNEGQKKSVKESKKNSLKEAFNMAIFYFLHNIARDIDNTSNTANSTDAKRREGD